MDRDTADAGISLTSAAQVVQISSGLEHACAVRRDGRVLCWGTRSQLQRSRAEQHWPNEVAGVVDARSVAAAADHTCVLTQSGRVACWGLNTVGQLGTDEVGAFTSQPRVVPGLSEVVQISAGSSHTCALRRGGDVLCWGWNEHGQLGDGTYTERAVPQRVEGLTPAIQVAAGEQHTCALTRSAETLCWGSNRLGEVSGRPGDDITKPVVVDNIRSAEAVTAGGSSCAIDGSQRVRCWGEIAAAGQPGTPGGHPFVDIEAGTGHACATTERGRVFCWGANPRGELGDGTQQNALRPATEVHLPRPAVQVSAGFLFSCAVSKDGEAFCWGSNGASTLGDGTDESSPTPVRVALPEE